MNSFEIRMFLRILSGLPSESLQEIDRFGFYFTFNLCWEFPEHLESLNLSSTKFGEFLAIISLNIFSALNPFSSPSGTPMLWMLDLWVLSHRSLKLCSFSLLNFTFYRLHSVRQLQVHPLFPLLSPFCCRAHPVDLF